MKIQMTKCDNKNCKVTSDKELNKLVINNEVTLDLCDNCLTKILNLITNGIDTGNTGISKTKDVEDTSSTADEIASNATIIVNKQNKKKDGYKKLDDIGIENIRNMYILENMTSNDIAIRVGVSKWALDSYLRKHNIKKQKQHTISSNEESESV